MEEKNNIWVFPNNIQFGMAPLYSKRFEKIQFNETIIFDLSKTEMTHSSFIGFLIQHKEIPVPVLTDRRNTVEY